MANRLTCFLPFVFGGSQWEDQEQQQAQATPEKEIGNIYKESLLCLFTPDTPKPNRGIWCLPKWNGSASSLLKRLTYH